MPFADPVLTAAEMRVAEQQTIAAGTDARALMERAGQAAAEAIWAYAGPLPTLVLCGPGNNGGDGYVIARVLAERGIDVRVAASAPPATETARNARNDWKGAVETLEGAAPAAVLVDALLGTGLSRPLDDEVSEALNRLAGQARVRVAVDLPSGATTDDGAILSRVPRYDLTVTFGALKPSHLLLPAAGHMGRIATADIGIGASSALYRVGRPRLSAPHLDHHKYDRGYVAVLAGEMPGAASLCASTAARSGAGYVRLFAETPLAGVPHSVVQSRTGEGGSALSDSRIDVLAAGPGLGRSGEAASLLAQATRSGRPLVLDADALFLASEDKALLEGLSDQPILTPHAGEFMRLFGQLGGSKVDQTRLAAASADAVIVYKGADTVIAAPDGRAAISPLAPTWLASAGTGDVLTGIVAAMWASGMDGFDAACAAVWLHGRAAELAGPFMIADDLVAQLPRALGECL